MKPARVTSEMRAGVELQGFADLSDEVIGDIYYWLRVAPLLSAIWAFVATLMESAIACGLLALIAFAGAVASQHPFDVIYTAAVRPRRRTAAIPRYGVPRRVATAVVAAALVAESTCFVAGAVWPGRVIGFLVVLITGTLAATGFCVTSYVVARLRLTGLKS